MKYCSYCGAEVLDEAAFCEKCGKQLSAVPTEESLSAKKKKKSNAKGKPAKKKRRKKEAKPIPEVVGEPVDDGYDGYYNDVLPPDQDREQEGMDKELIQKIALLCIGFIFIVGLCVVMLYFL